MRLFVQHRRAYRLRATVKNAPLILLAAVLQIGVQLFQVACFRQGNPVVAPEVSAFALHSALLVATGGVAELALETPVRSKRNEAARLLPLMPTQDPLHRTRQVVVAQQPEEPVKIAKRPLVRFQKCLLCGMGIGSVIGSPAGHRAHLEYLQLDPLPTQNRPGLIPVALRFHAPGIALRYKYLPRDQS